MQTILLVSFIWNKTRVSDACFVIFSLKIDKVKVSENKNIVIIGDSFMALELCGWLTTGLAFPSGKQEDVEQKNVIVVMLLKAPMIRTKDNSCLKK